MVKIYCPEVFTWCVWDKGLQETQLELNLWRATRLMMTATARPVKHHGKKLV